MIIVWFSLILQMKWLHKILLHITWLKVLVILVVPLKPDRIKSLPLFSIIKLSPIAVFLRYVPSYNPSSSSV